LTFVSVITSCCHTPVVDTTGFILEWGIAGFQQFVNFQGGEGLKKALLD